MRIQPICNQNQVYNVNCKSIYKKDIKHYGILTLIAGSSLFMLSNALDSLEPSIPAKNKFNIKIMDSAASALSIIGTVLSLNAIKKDEE